MSETETIAMVMAARAGDRGAMERLYLRFAPVVHGVLLGYVQHADAHDLTQDVFETALQRLHTLRDAAAFPGWIVSIARHAALDAKRRPAAATDSGLERLAEAGSVSRPSAHCTPSSNCPRPIAKPCCCGWWKDLPAPKLPRTPD